MMNNLKIYGIDAIEKCVGEFQIWAQEILPYGKMKVKIYENQDGVFTGYTDVRIIRKFDNDPEGAVGHGKTIDEALIDTLNYFIEIVKENYPIEKYPNGLLEENIVYSEFSDF